MDEPNAGVVRVESEPEITMSAVKLDRDGNVVETISFDNVEAHIDPGFLADLKRAAKEGWQEGKANQRKDS